MRQEIDYLLNVLRDYQKKATTISEGILKTRELDIAEYRRDIDKLESDLGTFKEVRAKTQVKQKRAQLNLKNLVDDPKQKGLNYSQIQSVFDKLEKIKRDPENEAVKNLGNQLKQKGYLDFLDQTLVLKRFIQLNYELSVLNVDLKYLNIKARTAGKKEEKHADNLKARLAYFDQMIADLNMTIVPAVKILVREVNNIVASGAKEVGIEPDEKQFESQEAKYLLDFARAMNSVMLAFKLELANLKDKRVDVENAMKVSQLFREVLPKLNDPEHAAEKSAVEALLVRMQPDTPLPELQTTIDDLIQRLNDKNIVLNYKPASYSYDDSTTLAVEGLLEAHQRSVTETSWCIFSFRCFSALPTSDEVRLHKIVELKENGAPQNVIVGAIVKLFEESKNYGQVAQKKTAEWALNTLGIEPFFCPVENTKQFIKEYHQKVAEYRTAAETESVTAPLLS